MEKMGNTVEELEFFQNLETAETEEKDKNNLILTKQVRKIKKATLTVIKTTAVKLIDKLSKLTTFQICLITTMVGILLKIKFTLQTLHKDKGQGYISNNFGQDLSKFKKAGHMQKLKVRQRHFQLRMTKTFCS